MNVCSGRSSVILSQLRTKMHASPASPPLSAPPHSRPRSKQSLRPSSTARQIAKKPVPASNSLNIQTTFSPFFLCCALLNRSFFSTHNSDLKQTRAPEFLQVPSILNADLSLSPSLSPASFSTITTTSFQPQTPPKFSNRKHPQFPGSWNSRPSHLCFPVSRHTPPCCRSFKDVRSSVRVVRQGGLPLAKEREKKTTPKKRY